MIAIFNVSVTLSPDRTDGEVSQVGLKPPSLGACRGSASMANRRALLASNKVFLKFVNYGSVGG
jgi:hypothetical protein